MGIFDVFTGDPIKEGAEKSRQYLAGVNTTGRSDIDAGLAAGRGAITGGTATGRADIAAGYGDAQGYLSGASGAFAPLSALGQKYGGGTDLYLDALGVRGAEGNTRAGAAFQPSGAYNFNLDQGLEAINRRRNAGGMLDSGNADRDAQEFGAGLASKEYGSWLDRLGGLVNPELSATSGAATGVAGIGRDQANLASSRGSMLADLASREGTSLAGLESGAAGQKVGLASSLASPYSKTYGDEANAEMAGSKNLWDFGLNAAKAAASFSDRRMKDDIAEVGKLYDGTPVYSFRYKGDPRTQIGLMAQDVEKYAPEAVIEINGFKAVDYRLATERSRRL